MSDKDAKTILIKSYRAKPGAHMSDEQATRYGRRLEVISIDGTITPEEVVEDARHAGSPLNDWFEWDRDTAAHQYHLVQAREMLRSIEVEVSDTRGEPVAVRGFHVVKLGEHEEKYYATLARVLSEDDLRKQVVKSALDELLGWRERYRTYSELMGVIVAIDGAVADVRV